MRKVLFTSTALVAFSAISGAQAAEPIKLQLGGFAHQWWGWTSNSNDGPTVAVGNNSVTERNEVANRDNVEIFFTGSTKLDNGITVAVRVELEGAGGANSSQVDEQNLTISGGFGRLILGGEDNVTAIMQVLTPSVGYGVGFVEGGIWVSAPTNVSTLNVTGFHQATFADDSDVQKITYITPSFFGFQAGYSYTPNWQDSGYGITSDAAGLDVHSGAISYTGKFGDVGFKADVGAFSSNGGTIAAGGGTSTGALKGWRAGANVSFAGFTLGGHYFAQDQKMAAAAAGVNTTPVSRKGNIWSLGAMYETGPWGVSLGYGSEKVEGLVSNNADDKTQHWELAGKYILGPGIDVALAWQNWNFESEDNARGNENKGNVIMTGIRVAF